MEPEQPLQLTLWQKIVQRRSKTQEFIQALLASSEVTKREKTILRQLVTTDIRDGFPREKMDAFIQQIKSDYRTKIPQYFWTPQVDQELSKEEIIAITTDVLSQMKKPGWRVVYAQNKKIFSVNNKKKTITVPNKTLTANELKGVLAHELLVHVMRWTNSTHAMKGYKMFEEGLATAMQFYVMGEKIIPYGRNKVRDFLLLLFEVGVNDVEFGRHWKIIANIAPESKSNYNWIHTFIKKIQANNMSKQMVKKYKLYTTGTHRFERFINRYNSKNESISILAKEITRYILEYKFDGINSSNLIGLHAKQIMAIKPNSIITFCKKIKV